MNLLLQPIRVQRSRQHKMVNPNGLPIVYVGRPSIYGNPFIANGDNKKAVENFVIMLKQSIYHINKIKFDLKGKNLSCWCPLDQSCHADILLKIANS